MLVKITGSKSYQLFVKGIVETLSGGSIVEIEDPVSTQEPLLIPKEQIRIPGLAKIQSEQDFPTKRSAICDISSALGELRIKEVLRMNQSRMP